MFPTVSYPISRQTTTTGLRFCSPVCPVIHDVFTNNVSSPPFFTTSRDNSVPCLSSPFPTPTLSTPKTSPSHPYLTYLTRSAPAQPHTPHENVQNTNPRSRLPNPLHLNRTPPHPLQTTNIKSSKRRSMHNPNRYFISTTRDILCHDFLYII